MRAVSLCFLRVAGDGCVRWSCFVSTGKMLLLNMRNVVLFSIVYLNTFGTVDCTTSTTNCGPVSASTADPPGLGSGVVGAIVACAVTVVGVSVGAFFFWLYYVPVEIADTYTASPLKQWTSTLIHGPVKKKETFISAQRGIFYKGSWKERFWTGRRMKEFANHPGRFEKPKYSEVYEKDIQIVRLAPHQPLPSKFNFIVPENLMLDRRKPQDERRKLGQCWSKIIGCKLEDKPFMTQSGETELITPGTSLYTSTDLESTTLGELDYDELMEMLDKFELTDRSGLETMKKKSEMGKTKKSTHNKPPIPPVKK